MIQLFLSLTTAAGGFSGFNMSTWRSQRRGRPVPTSRASDMSKRKAKAAAVADSPYVVVVQTFPAVDSGVHRGRKWTKA